MRLHKVHYSGHGLRDKLRFMAMRVVMGAPVPGVIRTLMYRRPFFGGPQTALTQQVMRGPSEWSVGERELFAAFVSRVNQCPF